MIHRKIWRTILAGGLIAASFVILPAGVVRAEAPAKTGKQALRDHWENVVLFFGDEESGEWSLRLRDQDVHQRGWFEYLELWQFDAKEECWKQIKVDKYAKAIVMPKQKGSDQPEKEQTLVDFKEIEPRTAGLWYAKWKIDDIECGTLMRVGTARTTNKLADGNPPDGMVKMAVPITLDKAQAMFIPDPRVYCVAGGLGKPESGKK